MGYQNGFCQGFSLYEKENERDFKSLFIPLSLGKVERGVWFREGAKPPLYNLFPPPLLKRVRSF